MSLDIDTPRGQRSREHEASAVLLLERHYRGLTYYPTPKTSTARVDGVLVNNMEIRGVVETKCRDFTLQKLRDEFNNEWLVTFEKLEHGGSAAELLQVPFIGMLYLVPDHTLLFKALYRPNIGWVARFRVARTETKATINGGVAGRANAYIDMADAKILR